MLKMEIIHSAEGEKLVFLSTLKNLLISHKIQPGKKINSDRSEGGRMLFLLAMLLPRHLAGTEPGFWYRGPKR